MHSDQHLYDDARKTFRDICMKYIDWPEAVWEAWVNFEQLHGSVEQLDDAMDRIERANFQLSARRAKVPFPSVLHLLKLKSVRWQEAQRADQQASQIIADAQATAATVVESISANAMDVDGAGPSQNGTKRKAEDEDEPSSSKKQRMGKLRCFPPSWGFN